MKSEKVEANNESLQWAVFKLISRQKSIKAEVQVHLKMYITPLNTTALFFMSIWVFS